MVIEGLKNLVLFAPKEEVMERIRDVVSEKITAYPYSINFLDVIQTGRKAWIQIYVNAQSDTVNIKDLKSLGKEIKATLADDFGQLYVDVVPDMVEDSANKQI